MMKPIDWNQTIHTLVQRYPDLPDVLCAIGFVDIVKPGMLNTVGRFVTLKQGCSMRHIDVDFLKKGLEAAGFTVEEDPT